jgi:hypothetical protein
VLQRAQRDRRARVFLPGSDGHDVGVIGSLLVAVALAALPLATALASAAALALALTATLALTALTLALAATLALTALAALALALATALTTALAAAGLSTALAAAFVLAARTRVPWLGHPVFSCVAALELGGTRFSQIGALDTRIVSRFVFFPLHASTITVAATTAHRARYRLIDRASLGPLCDIGRRETTDFAGEQARARTAAG